MRVVGRGDHDRVDLIETAHRLGIGRGVHDVPLGLALLEDLRVGIADRHQLGARVEPQARQVVIGRHGPGTDERHANLPARSQCRHLADPFRVLAFACNGHYPARIFARNSLSARGERGMAGEKPIRVAIVGLGFGAEFIPIYQKYPGAEIYAICRRDRKGLDECGERYGIKTRLHRLPRSAQRPERRRRSYQLADPRPRLDVDRGLERRQTRRLHRADGHLHRRMQARSSKPSARAARST